MDTTTNCDKIAMELDLYFCWPWEMKRTSAIWLHLFSPKKKKELLAGCLACDKTLLLQSLLHSSIIQTQWQY